MTLIHSPIIFQRTSQSSPYQLCTMAFSPTRTKIPSVGWGADSVGEAMTTQCSAPESMQSRLLQCRSLTRCAYGEMGRGDRRIPGCCQAASLIYTAVNKRLYKWEVKDLHIWLSSEIGKVSWNAIPTQMCIDTCFFKVRFAGTARSNS